MDRLLKFPTSFTIKTMGANHTEIVKEACAIIARHSNTFNPKTDVTIKESVKGKYLSISATIIATSQQQLDDIYIELNKHPLVAMTL